jgi:hypothetical protein
MGGEENKVPQKKENQNELENQKKINLSSPLWLAHGHGRTKKVHPLVHHPSTLVH